MCVCVRAHEFRYLKVSDPGSWLSVGEETGELKVTNLIDLESDLVTNAMYNITVNAVDPSECWKGLLSHNMRMVEVMYLRIYTLG